MPKTSIFLPVILGFTLVCGAPSAGATSAKSITLTVSEKSVSDALALALRLAAKKHLNHDGAIQKAVLDAEVMLLAKRFYEKLGIDLTIPINSI